MKISFPIAIVIVLVVVLGVYASFYAYAVNNIEPQDLKTFEKDLKNIDSTKIPESDINSISNLANQIKTGTKIKELPEKQVSTYSAAMKPSQKLKISFENLNNKTKINQAIATRYDFLLKGDLAKEIRTAYNTKMVDLRQKMISTQEKAAKDFKKGNNTAVAADLKQYVKYAKEYNKITIEAKKSLEKIVEQLKT